MTTIYDYTAMQTSIDEVLKLCIDVLAHSELDLEITIGGNGCSAFECSPMARKILEIIYKEEEASREIDVGTMVEVRVEELTKDG